MTLKLTTLGVDPRSMQRTQTRLEQRSWFDIGRVLLALACGAALAVALVAASPSPSGNSAGAAAETVYVVPASVNATCKHDVTYALGNWLLSVPNGTPGHDSVAELGKGACYELNGSIWWRGPRFIVLDGNGATIRQESVKVPAPEVGGKDKPKIAPYCGSGAYRNNRYSGIYKTVLMFSVEGGCDITVENLKIDGTHTGTGTTPNLQPDTFLTFYGTQRALVDNVTMSRPYGDYVDASGLHEAPGGGGGFPATDVTVEHCTFGGSGRQGISETNGAHRVTIEYNTFYGAADTVFDDETDVTYKAPIDTDILIAHNQIVGQKYGFLMSAQTGTELQRVAFIDNTLTDGAQMRIYLAPHAFGKGLNNNVEIEGNTSEASSAWPSRSPVNVFNTVNVLVAGNTDPPPIFAGKPSGRPFAALANAQSDLACGNTTPRGADSDSSCPVQLPEVTPPAVAALPS
jgi:hypothetical protein